ncbi:acid phosphatase protein [Rutstroemia sp. NJR-2017a WRK4]|nr:acid phosphatase protein [Rutstroemia sp. NJR-2017a WRK4]
MAGYDTLTISSTTSSNEILRLTAPDSVAHDFNMDAFSHDMNFEADGILDDVNTGLHTLPFTPSYELSDAFSTTFEDPFSYQSGTFDSLMEEQNQDNNAETNSSDPDNKLLGFGPPIIKAPILDDAGQTWPTMSAELYGMFFVAEDVFGGETAGRPMELTCYRRNLFQISGNITISRSICSMLNEQGQQIPIYDLAATISAAESIEGKSTEIISVPWKTANLTTSEDKAGATPPQWPLDLSLNPELDQTCVTIPIAWKRLQFKHATANNGRRKGLQQHYVVQINLVATLATGDKVKLAEIRSGPIIVRGRSPRNFDSRKDVQLSDKKPEPKARSMSETGPQVKVDPASAQSSYKFYAPNAVMPLPDLPEWPNLASPALPPEPPTPTHRSKKVAPSASSSSSHNRPPVPKTRWKSDPSPTKGQSQPAVAPIDLSLADDDAGLSLGTQPHTLSRHSSFTSDKDRTLGRKGSAERDASGCSKTSKKMVSMNSPENNEEALYEYFPLTLDDWMPPVDAVYRPHVVHHTIVPEDLKAQQGKSKTKRYFSADD